MNSALLRLDWNGAVITRRAADDYVNLSALVRAHNLATGQKRQLQSWYRSADAQEFLDALAADTGFAPGVVTPGVLKSYATTASAGSQRCLIECRNGIQTWGHPRVALCLARWLSPALEVKVDAWFSERVGNLQELLEAVENFEVPEEFLSSSHPLYVYAIRNEETGRVKLGISFNPEARLRQLQSANDCKLTLLAYRRAVNGYQDERRLHEAHKEKRVRGEWFDVNASNGTLLVPLLEAS